jgi:hypothetical protein
MACDPCSNLLLVGLLSRWLQSFGGKSSRSTISTTRVHATLTTSSNNTARANMLTGGGGLR